MPIPSSTVATDEAMMNMIHNGGGHKGKQVDDHYSPQPKQVTPTDTQQSVVSDADAKKKKRGLLYSSKEDEFLCLAWLGTSVDPFQGIWQKSSLF